MKVTREIVNLRKKPMKDGGDALILDYTVNGIRYREAIHMYLLPETNQRNKNLNMITLKNAEVVRAKKILDIQSGLVGIKPKVNDISLTEFLSKEKERYNGKGKNKYADCIEKLIRWLTIYQHKVGMQQVDKEYLLDFFDFLSRQHNIKSIGRSVGKKGLSAGTIHQYYEMLGTMFNNAVRQRLISYNPIKDFEPQEKPKAPESRREYLTLDELNKLIATPIRSTLVRNAFLFSCFTGLRIGDLRGLLWSDIKDINGTKQIILRQNKTARIVYIPLSENALSFLPVKVDKYVFPLPSQPTLNDTIQNWIKRSGIKKHISWHCSRHTYATLLLTYGADLYTVSKLLGHSHIGITQVYAKIIDQKRVEAVNLIPRL